NKDMISSLESKDRILSPDKDAISLFAKVSMSNNSNLDSN
ncbi:30083_t:CDS:1, partial [Racocetra persica]